MNRLVWIALALIAGPLVLSAATPAITRLLSALTPLVLVVGVLAIAWRLVSHFTRR